MHTATNQTKKKSIQLLKPRKKSGKSKKISRIALYMKPVRKTKRKLVTYVSNHQAKSAGVVAVLAVVLAGAAYLKSKFL
jgi:hypothetical protein